jgi:uncharacterized protein DUF4157/protein-glutamine gamma-glutamyltransferase-like protein
MRIFAQKPQVSKQSASAQPARLERARFGRTFEVNSNADLRRAIGNEATQPSGIGTKGVEADSSVSRTPGFHRDFSGITIHPLARPRMQPKLTVNTPGDICEQEADRVADEVLRMPEHAVLPGMEIAKQTRDRSVGRMCATAAGRNTQSSEGAEGTLTITPAVAARLDVTKGTGAPLSQPARSFMEPRFGCDFSAVRVHTGSEAAWLNQAFSSLAFTRQRDIYFAAGNYNPESTTGRRLLAHELAHVAQEDNNSLTIKRKIKTDPQASLSAFLSSKGVTGFKESNSVYERPKGGALSFEQELLIDMLASPRLFHLDGDSDATAGSNLSAHVKARTGIVSFASKKQYNFAALSGWSMNPAFYEWDISKGTWKVKPGVDRKAAWEDININPKLYAIGCAAATDITMKGGSGGANIIDIPSGDQADWVAGDSGYVENTKYPSTSGNIGLLGENIIYTGGGMFWGHFTGSVTYRTLPDWVAMVNSWNGGSKVDTKRELPATGLLDK